jgi:SET domain-containing protein
MICNNKIFVKNSPIHGLGVFAKEPIKNGELIEKCPVLTLPIYKDESSDLLIHYRFNWPQGNEWEEQVVALGYGSLYNHSEDANAFWISSSDEKCFEFYAIKDIEEGEEIFVWYGDENYWNDGRNDIEVI